ncbi:MAG: hypothetical protein PF517_13030 [Salinivirgaceae bacterium]|jgi:hypothetical protein|nr:hypothetical protein [Salinivirgaceae bacterium]
MQPLNRTLKTKLFILSLLFPLSFGFIGGLMGYFLYTPITAIIFVCIGLIIGIALNIVCYYRKLFTITLFQSPIPLSMFLLVLWISNAFMSDLYAFLFAIGGLLIGLWLNNELILPFQFYRIRKRYLGIIYFFFSIAFMGVFMGIPAFNLLLGALAGNYLSIRVISNYRQERSIKKNLRQGAFYTSLILFIITALSGLIAISDIENSIQLATQIIKIPLNKDLFVGLIIVGGIAIVLLQYVITLFTAKTMLQLWKHKRFSRYAKN